MAQKVSRRTAIMSIWHHYGADDLLVIDEAHHAAAPGWERAMQQWPGRIIGMTATPWRLSKKEGFDHLFGKLICGPQTSELQSRRWLCEARVLLPPSKQRILGGEVQPATGEYTESGIELANRDRHDVMTAQVLLFWQRHAHPRQTIIYAVSVKHARNLVNVFNDAGIPAASILADTPLPGRVSAIDKFKKEALRVLVNVAVATEGFDLPDASCIVLARPTKSLALYLQMAGRGLRPKENGGDCVLLDLAGNAVEHGLPEEDRRWSLAPRGEEMNGEAPVVWCSDCKAVSSAASHRCGTCGVPFGKECDRCGKWRPWTDWSLEEHCGNAHALVCDRCHLDAHVRSQLPVLDLMKWLSGGKTMDPNAAPNSRNDTSESELDSIVKELLEDECRSVLSDAEQRRQSLRSKIETRETQLVDDSVLDRLFADHLNNIPNEQRPRKNIHRHRLYVEWHDEFEKELADWKEEYEALENQQIDEQSKQLIVNRARGRLVKSLERQAEAAGLYLTEKPEPDGGQNLAIPAINSRTKHLEAGFAERVKGDLVIRGSLFSYNSGKSAMVIVLRELARLDSNFLQRCAQDRAFRGKKRRYLARRVEDLFPDRPDLRKLHERLEGGWLVSTNLPNPKKEFLIKAAVRVAGLTLGRDVIVPFMT